MKVICSNDKWRQSPECMGRQAPVYMEECIVVGEFNYFGSLFYELSGYNPDSLFHSDHFIKMSDCLEESAVNTKEEYV